jgi:hypothetical protein
MPHPPFPIVQRNSPRVISANVSYRHYAVPLPGIDAIQAQYGDEHPTATRMTDRRTGIELLLRSTSEQASTRRTVTLHSRLELIYKLAFEAEHLG